MRVRFKEDPDELRDRKLQAKYGIGLSDYNEMFDAQDGRCKICLRPGSKFGRGRTGRLHVDHNHSTKVVRGLLCYACNGLLGFAGESTDVLARSIQYLKDMG